MLGLYIFSHPSSSLPGLVLAIFAKTGMITPYNGVAAVTISASYQNILVCVEMFFASVMLRFAFPFNIYRIQNHKLTDRAGIKTISSNFRKSINPKDIFQDTIHNFSPAYQHYAGVNKAKNMKVSVSEDGREVVSYQVTLPHSARDDEDSSEAGEHVVIGNGILSRDSRFQNSDNQVSSLSLVETDDDQAILIN